MDTKTCTTCKIEKSLDGFSKRPDSKDGFRSQCSNCVSVRGAEYYQRNRASKLRQRREYRESHREEIHAQKVVYAASPKGREYQRTRNLRVTEVGQQRRTEYLLARCQLRSELSGTSVEDASELLLHHWQPNEKSMRCDYMAFAKDADAAARESDLYCVAILRSEHMQEHRAWERGETLLARLRPDAQPWVKDSNGEWVPYEQQVAA